MASFKQPTFQERAALAQKARDKALKKLAAKPPMDEAESARRKEAQLAREAAAAEKSRARKAAIEQAKADRQAAATAAAKPVQSEAQKKTARDEKYAARKKRKK
ncbi:MAG: hypothetical protein APF78_09130 [Sphingomonadales bacterium BRH_c3]|nr:MAG: hypothetical protein APF78_09130 [Sphingomonadales bacterium BRH_c3]